MPYDDEKQKMQRVHFDKPAPKDEPPHNFSAEAALIGAVLFDNDVFWRVCPIVRGDDFYAEQHRWLWRRISSLIDVGKQADGVTLQEACDQSDKLKDLGGSNYLFDLLDSAAAGPEIMDYAKIVSDLSARRGLLVAADGLREAAATPTAEMSTTAVLGLARGLLDRVEDRHLESSPSCADLADATFADTPTAVLMPTGFWSLDHELGGMERGGITLVGARPGVGKTAFGICVAAHAAQRGESVGFFAADMGGAVTRQRLAWYIAHMAGDQLPAFSEMRKPNSPWVTPGFRERMAGHLKSNTGRRVLMSDKPGLNTQMLRYQIRAWKRDTHKRGLPPLGMVAIDHIGKLAPSQAYRGLYEKTSYASNELLDIAKEHPEICFVAMAQLNRVTSQEQRRPSLADLRDSGKLEEDASAVILLHREDLYLHPIANNLSLPDSERQKAKEQLDRVRLHFEAIIGKNRNGQTTTIGMRHVIAKNIIRDASYEEKTETQESLL